MQKFGIHIGCSNELILVLNNPVNLHHLNLYFITWRNMLQIGQTSQALFAADDESDVVIPWTTFASSRSKTWIWEFRSFGNFCLFQRYLERWTPWKYVINQSLYRNAVADTYADWNCKRFSVHQRARILAFWKFSWCEKKRKPMHLGAVMTFNYFRVKLFR